MLGRSSRRCRNSPRWVKALGVWGPIAFIVGYGIAAVVLAPAFLLTVTAGAIWGMPGVLYVMVGATLGAVLAFYCVSLLSCGRYVERYVCAIRVWPRSIAPSRPKASVSCSCSASRPSSRTCS